MKTLIKDVQIIAPGSSLHGKKGHLLLENGIIRSLTQKAPAADEIVEGASLVASPGWVDLQSDFCDPGREHSEDLLSGREAAAAGGFTEVALVPNTHPPVESKSDVMYITRHNSDALVRVHAIAAVSEGLKGENITEMVDMHRAGAIAFSDGLLPVWHDDVMLKALQYVQVFDGLVINRPDDHMISRFGVMHEGEMSTLLGMKGIPPLAEALMVQRDIMLLEYAGGRLHLSNISTEESVKLIKAAQKKGMPITCDVAAPQLAFTDDDLESFDTHYKVNPPLRNAKHQKALIKALEDGVIQTIVSSHQPHDLESKQLEFDLAEFGMLGLQTVLPILNQHFKPAKIVELLAINSRAIVSRDLPAIEKGEAANLTIFSPTEKWKFSAETNRSKSINSPLYGQELKGRVKAVFNNGRQQIF